MKRIDLLQRKLEKLESKRGQAVRLLFWKYIHYTIAVVILVAIAFGYGTFFPNPVSVSKINHEQDHIIFGKIDNKLDKIAIQNRKNLEEDLLLELHQPEFVYNDPDSFIYAVRQCVDFINYTTDPNKRIPGTIIIAMAGWTVFAWIFVPDPILDANYSNFSAIATVKIPAITHLFDFNLSAVFSGAMVSVVFTLFFVDFFDTAGTLTSVANVAGKVDKKGRVEDIDKALLSDSVGTVAGALLGTTTVTSYIESGAGVKEGGRTGMTSIVIGVLFLLMVFFSPLFLSIPKQIDAAVLIFISVLFLQQLKDIEWNDIAESGPAVLAALTMAFTYNISHGIAIAFVAYALIKICTGKMQGVSPAIWVVAVLSALNLYIYS